MATIAVRMGELAVSRDAGTALIIHGLGSCVGLSLWDPRARVAGMAHFMLPAGRGDEPPAKFVDGGLQRFLVAFEAAGGSRRRAQVKAAGGARILTLTSGLADIGRRNAEAVQAGLVELGLSLTASDLGGTMARTIELSTETGALSVRSASVTRGL
jgi:chemotaxis protein CheD